MGTYGLSYGTYGGSGVTDRLRVCIYNCAISIIGGGYGGAAAGASAIRPDIDAAMKFPSIALGLLSAHGVQSAVPADEVAKVPGFGPFPFKMCGGQPPT